MREFLQWVIRDLENILSNRFAAKFLGKTLLSRNFCKNFYTAHSEIFYDIHTHVIFGQTLNFFRENNLLIAHRVKHILGNSNFDQLGVNLRKFHIFDGKINALYYINHLRYLPRMAQKDFYRNVKCANINT